MTERATLGQFLETAHRQLQPAKSQSGANPLQSVEEAAESLRRLTVVMNRYVHDIGAEFTGTPPVTDTSPSPWVHALTEARQALTGATEFLFRPEATTRIMWRPRRATGPVARQLDAATATLTMGRDLLHTHFTSAIGHWHRRSEWSSLITSAPVSRALLAEIGTLARLAARQGAEVALAPQASGSGQTRQLLNAACQRLWLVDNAMRAAHRQEPISPSGHELLQAIPVNALPPLRVPTGGESIAGMCAGAVNSAKRLRHLAWISAQQPSWSPAMNVTSLHQVAANGTVTSHNCHVVLDTLAIWAARNRQPDLGAQLSAAAAAAGYARQQWLSTVHGLGMVTTDCRGYVSPVAAESGTLALWLGRLAYADPAWTLKSGPARAPRSPESLAPTPQDAPLVVAAVHHACGALSRVGQIEGQQVRAAADARRILVPTRSLPDSGFDVPRPFAPAVDSQVHDLLTRYSGAWHSSDQATDALGTVAEATHAPSRILTVTRSVMVSEAPGHTGAEGLYAGPDPCELPGPVERTLVGLGVTAKDVLNRGAELDQASRRLIIEAVAQQADGRGGTSMRALNQSTATSEILNHALDSGDHLAVELLGHPVPAEAEPEP